MKYIKRVIFLFHLGVKFFRENIYRLLIEMDTFDFFDERHYFATFLHPKHRDMSEFTTFHCFSNKHDNSFYILIFQNQYQLVKKTRFYYGYVQLCKI